MSAPTNCCLSLCYRQNWCYVLYKRFETNLMMQQQQHLQRQPRRPWHSRVHNRFDTNWCSLMLHLAQTNLTLPLSFNLARRAFVFFWRSFAFVICLLLPSSCPPQLQLQLQLAPLLLLIALSDRRAQGEHINKCVLFVWPFNFVIQAIHSKLRLISTLNVDHHHHRHSSL